MSALETADLGILVLMRPWGALGASAGGEGKCHVDAVEGDEEVGCSPDFGEGVYDAGFEAGVPDEFLV